MKLGEILVAAQAIDDDGLARGLAHASTHGLRLGSALVDLGLTDAETVTVALAKQRQVPPARESHFRWSPPEVAALIPAELAHRRRAVALGIIGDKELAVALVDPADPDAIAELARATGYTIRPAVACARRLEQALAACYGDAALAAPPLELAAVPPRAAAAPPLRPAVHAVPLELGEPPRRSPVNRSLVIGAIIAAAVVAGMGLTHRRKPDKGRPVAGAFAATYVGLELTFPATDWRYQPSQDAREQQGTTIERASFFYRGGDPDEPDLALGLLRLQSDAPMQTEMPDDDFARVMRDFEADFPSHASAGGFRAKAIQCKASARRDGQVAECTGTGSYRDHDYELEVFIWVEADDALVVAAFFAPPPISITDHEIDEIIPTIARAAGP